MKKRLIQAVILQSCGPLLLLALSVAISKFLGPSEQGAFVSLKSWADVIIAIGCFGFPQSVIIAINRYSISRRSLYSVVPVYVVGLTPVFFVICYLAGAAKDFPINQIIALVVGIACIVLVNIWRGILLTIEDGFRFHLITALPSTALVVVISMCLALGFSLKNSLPYFYGACGVITLIAGYCIFPWRLVQKREGKSVDFWQLITNGGDVFVQGIASSLQIYFCFSWLKHVDSLTVVGYFSIALVALNAFGFPLQSVAPMILNRWSREGDAKALHSGAKSIKKVLIAVTLISLISIGLTPFIVDRVLGLKFHDAVAAIQIMLLAITPLLVFRLASLRLVAVGQFRFNSIVIAARSLMLISLLNLVDLQSVAIQPVTVAALCWLIVEVLAAIVISCRVNHVRNALVVGEKL